MSDGKKTEEVKRFTVDGRSGSWCPLGDTGLIKLLFDDGECVIAEMHEDAAKETK
jgi:hypothetical protein